MDVRDVGMCRLFSGGFAFLVGADVQSVPVTEDGYFLPPAEIVEMLPLGQKYLLVYHKLTPPFCFVYSRRVGKSYVTLKVKFFDFHRDLSLSRLEEKVFSFTTGLVALRQALEFGPQEILHVLSVLRAPAVLAKGGGR